eukprot:TRINITY_DN12632_c5_g4_i1.p1 TRINITY_DN12632_c5_g4~~TRINITY_DN12632_c5_g4_i1.p1  ORF type:complete len:104 (+),score=4.62 TRINITY_DN12632_c5_g4_i1:263-574(+)
MMIAGLVKLSDCLRKCLKSSECGDQTLGFLDSPHKVRSAVRETFFKLDELPLVRGQANQLPASGHMQLGSLPGMGEPKLRSVSLKLRRSITTSIARLFGTWAF